MPTATAEARVYPSVAAMASDLTGKVSESIVSAVADRGHALVAVSGGRFSRHLFQSLSGAALPWPSVTIVLADERWVETDSELSNEKLVRDTLFHGPASEARLVGLKTGGKDPAAELARIEASTAALPLPFDLVLLGMGDDGHTASLFPSAPIDELNQALCPRQGQRVAVLHPTASPMPRITLTLPTLLCARRIVLHIPGRSKLATYRRAFDEGPIQQMPVRGVLRQKNVPVEVLLCETDEP